MARFPPVDMAIVRPEFRTIWDPERHRQVRKDLETLSYQGGDHDYCYCWGYTIFRTVYTPGSDEAFARAVERLGVYAKASALSDLRIKFFNNGQPPDPTPNHDLWNRYYSEVVEDPETLADASIEEVGSRFEAWVDERLVRDEDEKRRPAFNSRFSLCLMLDQESLDNILAMPEEPVGPYDKTQQQRSLWVRVVSTVELPEGGGRLWLRAGIDGYVWSLCFAAMDTEFWPDGFEYGFFEPKDGGGVDYMSIDYRDLGA